MVAQGCFLDYECWVSRLRFSIRQRGSVGLVYVFAPVLIWCMCLFAF